VSIGEALACARVAAGFSTTQLSQRTRIRETVIRGIENDDFSPCGGDFYARGHIRSIARLTGIDPVPLIAEYDAARGGLGQVSAAEIFEPATPIKLRERRSPNLSAAMAVVIAAIIGYLAVHAIVGSSHHLNQAAARAPAQRPAASAPAAAGPTAHATRHRRVVVQLRAIARSWVSVSALDGKLIYAGTLPPGSTRTWVARQQLLLSIGNAGGVQLTVNGKNLGSPGGPGQVATVSFSPA
jgi:hypothetical protein